MKEVGFTRQVARAFTRWALGQSVRVKVMGIALVMLLLLGTSMIIIVHNTVRVLLEDELERRTRSIARELAAHSASLLVTNDWFALQQLLHESIEHSQDMRYAFITNADSANVVAHTFPPTRGFPVELLNINAKSGKDVTVQWLATDEGIIIDAAMPIMGL